MKRSDVPDDQHLTWVMRRTVTRVLLDSLRMGAAEADELARTIVDALCFDTGGLDIYMPKRGIWNMYTHDEKIQEVILDMKRLGPTAAGKKHGFSRSTVYRFYKEDLDEKKRARARSPQPAA